MTWFQDMTGCSEQSCEEVREQLFIDGSRLHSRRNGKSWIYGRLETPTLAELRRRAIPFLQKSDPISVQEIVANAQQLHEDKSNQDAMFQVASQFNLLEMAAPDVTPEAGVGIYEGDPTQGPSCAIAAGAGTIFRNYFVDVNGHCGQSKDNQIDCLADIGRILGNDEQRLWQMVNGYAFPCEAGLREIDEKLSAMNETSRDCIRQSLRIGIQWDTQVTINEASHSVSQAYCSALPVAYTNHANHLWKCFASLILEASYEATICAALLNAAHTKNQAVFLTLVGGGVFGNELEWILQAIRRALNLYYNSGLKVFVVSHSRSKPSVQHLVDDYSN